MVIPVLPMSGAWYERYKSWAAMQDLVERLEAGLLPIVEPGPGDEIWGPLPFAEFMRGEAICAEHAAFTKNWLEVGSGPGSHLHLAKVLGWNVEGIEVQPEYVGLSYKLFPEYPVTIVDAAEFDGYARFDVIYYYGIKVAQDDNIELLRSITERARRGALVFAPGGHDPDWLERVADDVWKV